jgi:RNA polymerase sigma-70 factor, ECF subfamily
MTDDPRRAALTARILGSLPGLTHFVRRRMGAELRARESASDIVQSTCRELLRSASSFEERGEASFQRWLQSAAEHKLANRARHWHAERRAGEPEALGAHQGAHQGENGAVSGTELEPMAPRDAAPSQEAMLREEVERLEWAFRALEPEHRSVVRRSQIDGASLAEIAAEMGRSSEAVRKLLARALARLSTHLEDLPPPGASERAGRTPVA